MTAASSALPRNLRLKRNRNADKILPTALAFFQIKSKQGPFLGEQKNQSENNEYFDHRGKSNRSSLKKQGENFKDGRAELLTYNSRRCPRGVKLIPSIFIDVVF